MSCGLTDKRSEESPKYKAGDRVEVVLDEKDSAWLNLFGHFIGTGSAINHIPAPDPVVRWVNVYNGALIGSEFVHRDEADRCNRGLGIYRTCVLRLEWADGDTSKKPSSVTVEGV